jgi:RNA polymerase sigma factor (sigma-70 family)
MGVDMGVGTGVGTGKTGDGQRTDALSLAEFGALMDACQRPLHAFLLRLLRDDAATRDVMQDTFCAAWQQMQRAKGPFAAGPTDTAGIRRWLFHAAYDSAVSQLRRRRIISWRSLDGERSNANSIAVVVPFEEQVAESQAMAAALAALPQPDVACLLLIVVHHFTAAEAGQVIGASPQAAAKRYARAKRRLRDSYLAQNPPPQERSRT